MPTHQYKPLRSGDNTLESSDAGGSDCEPRGFSSSPWTRFWNLLQVVLALELVHMVILATVYFIFYQHSSASESSKSNDSACLRLPASLHDLTPPRVNTLLNQSDASHLMKTYFSLHDYTVPYTLSDNNLTFLRNTLSADYYFNLTSTHRHGFVSLPDGSDLTATLNLPVTSIPTAPDHSIYQVSLFHHLHCLSRIQRWITTHPPFAPYNTTEFDEVYPLVETQSTESLDVLNHIPKASHALHCVEWLRQVLMCDADLRISLSNTDPKFLELGGEPVRMCRDWDAITSWVDGHQ